MEKITKKSKWTHFDILRWNGLFSFSFFLGGGVILFPAKKAPNKDLDYVN